MREKINKLIEQLRATNNLQEQDKIKEQIDEMEEKEFNSMASDYFVREKSEIKLSTV